MFGAELTTGRRPATVNRRSRPGAGLIPGRYPTSYLCVRAAGDRLDKNGKNGPPKWRPARTYVRDTLVRHDGVVYRCRSTHTAAADFEIDRKGKRWSIERINIRQEQRR